MRLKNFLTREDDQLASFVWYKKNKSKQMQINRRDFIKISSLVVGGVGVLGIQACQKKTLRFGWVTDVHYANEDVKWNRYYRESVQKLSEAVKFFNHSNLDFIIETGDFKDQTKEPTQLQTLSFLKQIEGVFSSFKGDKFHVLGNHDMDSLSKNDFLQHIENTGIDKTQSYYSFSKQGYLFVVLDACYKSDGTDYNNDDFSYKDTNIPDFELKWLKRTLNETSMPVIVFVHQRLDGDGDLYVNNASEVRQILEDCGSVIAVFQGHDHEGGAQQINNIFYYTQKAMVDGGGLSNNSYSIVTLKEGGVTIEGYKKAVSYNSLSKVEVI